MSEEKFWDSTPKEVEPYRKMDELRQKRMDYNMWLMGAYVTNAVAVGVANAVAGNKSKAKYLEKPFSVMAEEEENRDPADDFNKFAAYAVTFNENFKDEGKRGE